MIRRLRSWFGRSVVAARRQVTLAPAPKSRAPKAPAKRLPQSERARLLAALGDDDGLTRNQRRRLRQRPVEFAPVPELRRPAPGVAVLTMAHPGGMVAQVPASRVGWATARGWHPVPRRRWRKARRTILRELARGTVAQGRAAA